MTQEMIDGSLVALPEDDGGEARCAVVLALDCSYSMSGDPIAELNAGLTEFLSALQTDDLAARRCDVALVTFGGSVKIAQPFTLVSNLAAMPTLKAGGGTPMGEAICTAIDQITTRKAQYRQEGRAQYRPWIFLLTDGQPTDDVNQAQVKVQQGDANKSFQFFAVGCFSADMHTLKTIAPPSIPPVYLRGANFRDMFKWLSDSMGRVASSTPGQQVALPAASGWAQISS